MKKIKFKIKFNYLVFTIYEFSALEGKNSII